MWSTCFHEILGHPLALGSCAAFGYVSKLEIGFAWYSFPQIHSASVKVHVPSFVLCGKRRI